MRPQELNMLVIFDAIMTERSITRAADRLALTQPAVSNAVSRMRVIWKDELFVKDGRKIQPTTYAQNLWAQIREPLKSVTNAISEEAFDPSTAQRTFRVALADTALEMCWLTMRKTFEKHAPGINIHAVPYTTVNTEEVLEHGKVDLVVGVSSGTNSAIMTEFLFDPYYVCVMRKGHPLATKGRLTLKRFAEAEHLLVSLSGDTTGFTDRVLARDGLKRRIACTVNHFSVVPSLIKETDLITVIPCGPVEKAICKKELHAVKPPFDFPPAPIFVCWHTRQDTDQGLQWFRQHLANLIISETKRNTEAVEEMMKRKD